MGVRQGGAGAGSSGAPRPLIDAYFYEGDLLLTTVTVPPTVRTLLPDLAAQLRTALSDLPEAALADLPRGGAEKIARFAAGSDSPRRNEVRQRNSWVTLISQNGAPDSPRGASAARRGLREGPR
ncbi:hypothetical protein SAMN05216483_4628 [Streptomyces sp. 2131.1]|uniref:hypothetical protein n=1 Tax=Streptomyces sp. 2131.1 TaxID=1855346 RepID=UPI00089B5409|nr:hypothetical protein [Streptomyces sp. 2131.1]SED82427.1 hypothetical protein SAMN05216483_4628 [Streptomyces sp. 2131.1]